MTQSIQGTFRRIVSGVLNVFRRRPRVTVPPPTVATMPPAAVPVWDFRLHTPRPNRALARYRQRRKVRMRIQRASRQANRA